MSTATKTLDALMDRAMDADNNEFNATMDELLRFVQTDPEGLDALLARRGDIVGQLNDARVRIAGVLARLAAATLCLSDPDTTEPTPHPEFASGGPAREIALAATHIIRHSGDVIPLEAELDEALEVPWSDPNFESYPSIFAHATSHLQSAAYYLLDAGDSRAALASEPPEQDTFPPLPFPRIWIEMSHLEPFMRFISRNESPRRGQLDVLGVAIAEIEQGNVWDLYVPFQFDNDAEFFFLAGRITPNGVVECDRALEVAKHAFHSLAKLAIGAVHLVTARNVAVDDVAMPRHQRKRLQAEGATPTRLYFVNLARAGERTALGTTTREYHVRWLVRGHWRHVPSGKRFCTCCDPPQIASWVEPYIKGPVGAPWKGRQVRRQHP